jgi:hypothetical protein
MDRQVTQTGALIPNATLLGGEKAKLVGLGYALQAALGTGTVVDGLALSATAPASLSVVVGPGSIMTYAAVDPSAAFGDLGTDTTHFTMKQGLLQEPGQPLTLTPPSTAGYSQVYLVQAAYQDQDSFTVLPYYNASNPAVPYNGPNNSGNASLTLRSGQCVVGLKPGTAATTGTQVAPSPDPGYVGLYLITVANGATQITSANVVLYPTAPFLDLKLPQVRAAIQAQVGNYAEDTGSANAMAVTLPVYTPATLPKGLPLRVKKSASANTAALTVQVNGTTYQVLTEAAGALTGGEWLGGTIRTLIYDGTNFRLSGVSATQSNTVAVGLNTEFWRGQKTAQQSLPFSATLYDVTWAGNTAPSWATFDGSNVVLTVTQARRVLVTANLNIGIYSSASGFADAAVFLMIKRVGDASFSCMYSMGEYYTTDSNTYGSFTPQFDGYVADLAVGDQIKIQVYTNGRYWSYSNIDVPNALTAPAANGFQSTNTWQMMVVK